MRGGVAGWGGARRIISARLHIARAARRRAVVLRHHVRVDAAHAACAKIVPHRHDRNHEGELGARLQP